MKHETTHSEHTEEHTSIKSYVVGFILSIILTIIPFIMVVNAMLSKIWLIIAIFTFATTQLIVQMTYFMHLNEDGKPKWNFISLFFTIVILFIVVAGTLWIMYHLNHNLH